MAGAGLRARNALDIIRIARTLPQTYCARSLPTLQSHKFTSMVAESATEEANNMSIAISDSCVKQLKKIAEGPQFLRVMVDGGGCSGFQYNFELGEEIEEDDRVFHKDGVQVVVDKDSLSLISGSTVDYEVELIRAAFRITGNPHAEKGCSCGASFSVKI